MTTLGMIGSGLMAVEVARLAVAAGRPGHTVAYLTPYAGPGLTRLEDLRATPAVPVGAAPVKRLLAEAERTDQAARAF
jgi:hypothetical protein